MARKEAAGPNKWLQLAALSTVPLVMVLGNSMLIPVLPDMGRDMSLTKSVTGLAVTAFSLAASVGILAAGFLADRFGRKVVIVPSLLIYGLGGITSGLGGWLLAGDGFFVVMVGRVIQGLGAAGTMPVAMAFVGDLFSGGQRVTALGIIEASNGLGKVLSPILGALIGAWFIWWGVFFTYAAVALPFALLVALFTREQPRKRAAGVRQYFGAVGRVFRENGSLLLACLWTGTVALSILFGVLFFLSQHLETAYGIDGVPKGTLIMWPVLAMSVTSFGSGLFLQSHTHLLKAFVIAGLTLTTAGMLLVAFIPLDWAFFTGIVVGGIGTGLQLPGLNNLITSAAEASERAAITGLYGAVRFLGVAAGPPLYGWLMRHSDALPFWFSAGVLGVTLVIAILLIKPHRVSDGTGAGNPPGGRPKPLPQWNPPGELPAGTRGDSYEPIG